MKYVPSHSSSHCTYFVIIQMALILNCHLGCDNALKVVEQQSNVRRVINVFFFPWILKQTTRKKHYLPLLSHCYWGMAEPKKVL